MKEMKIKRPATLESLENFPGLIFWWQLQLQSLVGRGWGCSHPTIPCKLCQTHHQRAICRYWNYLWQISAPQNWTRSVQAISEFCHRGKEEEEESISCRCFLSRKTDSFWSWSWCLWWLRRTPRCCRECLMNLKTEEPITGEFRIRGKKGTTYFFLSD